MPEAPASFTTTSDPTDAPRLTPAVQWLLALNVAIYFLQVTIIQPADLQSALGFDPARFPSHWWGVLSYAFAHGGFWHVALNMYTLWVFGPRVEHAWSAGEFTRFYIVCALGGAAAHALLGRDGGLLIGASAAVIGVMVAYASRWPNDEVYLFGVFPMKVKWLVIGMAVLNLVSGFWAGATDGGVAYLAHVGGIVAGYLYLKMAQLNADRGRTQVALAPDYPEDGPRPVPRGTRPREPRSESDDAVAKSRALLSTGRRTMTASKMEPKRREALDRVLDKIAATGMHSLTTDERRLLDDESRRLRSDSPAS
jgi:membrane associated rhomboid family serine protease